MTENTLIVFVKNLIDGNVKTRIAKKKGNQFALQLYTELLNILKNSLSGLRGWEVVIYYSDFIEETDNWPFVISQERQNGINLGDRMYKAFKQELKKAEKVVMIGSDIPDLKKIHIQNASTSLQANDIVIGPTIDGGYYLIGMKKLDKVIFSGIKWGESDVYFETCKRLTQMNYSYDSLSKLRDIDEVDDIPDYVLRKLNKQ